MIVFLLLSVITCIRFHLPSTPEGNQFCLTQFVWSDTPVTGTAGIGKNNTAIILIIGLLILESTPQPFQSVDFEVTEGDSVLFSKKNLVDVVKFSFTTTSDVPVRFCFTSTLTSGFQSYNH